MTVDSTSPGRRCAPSPNGWPRRPRHTSPSGGVEVFGATPLGPMQNGAVASKSTPTDPVTVVDTETEALLRQRLAELRPGERGSRRGGRRPRRHRTPTPSPGCSTRSTATVNFVYGIPAYSVSVAAQVGGVSVAGCGRRRQRRRGVFGRRSGWARTCSAATAIATAALHRRRRAVDGVARARDSRTRRHAGPRRRALLAGLLPVVRDVRRIGLGRAGSVHGGGGPAGCALRARAQRVGLGCRGTDRGRGGRTGARCRRPTEAARVW